MLTIFLKEIIGLAAALAARGVGVRGEMTALMAAVIMGSFVIGVAGLRQKARDLQTGEEKAPGLLQKRFYKPEALQIRR